MQQKKIYCNNCSQYGHFSKNCIAPIMSYGCIVYRLPKGFKQENELLENPSSISGLERIQKNIEFLMIQRRDSFGYIEIIQGRYQLNDIEYIKRHISIMSKEEHMKIVEVPFDILWENLWGIPTEKGTQKYKNDKEQSKIKFELLQPSFPIMIAEIKNPWTTPEWGFPKGRHDPRETDIQCALRELYEETGITEKDISFIRNLEPLTETFFGSNHIHYCHKYYMIKYNSDTNKEVFLDNTNPHMMQEIGDIKWLTLDKCLEIIRPDNVEKKEVLLRANSLLRNYCPFYIS